MSNAQIWVVIVLGFLLGTRLVNVTRRLNEYRRRRHNRAVLRDSLRKRQELVVLDPHRAARFREEERKYAVAREKHGIAARQP